jgi:hypothetical protein
MRRSRASGTPQGKVDRPIQASGGRRRRPSRAFFVPLAIKVRGQRARAWTPCSSLRKRMANSELRIGSSAMYVRLTCALLPTPCEANSE